jgi:hypothetical protein
MANIGLRDLAVPAILGLIPLVVAVVVIVLLLRHSRGSP